jgi:Xaa-Pro aminopeptidase
MLRERGITRGRIGFDEASTLRDPSFWDKVKSKLPDLKAIPASQIFSEIRMVKSQEEVSRIQGAVEITEKAWNAALESVGAGTTEREFADVYQRTILSEGANHSPHGIYWPPIGFGRRCAFLTQPSQLIT